MVLHIHGGCVYGVKHTWEGCVSGVKDARGVMASMEPCFKVEKALHVLIDSRLSLGGVSQSMWGCTLY
jgi:hypothetical protein